MGRTIKIRVPGTSANCGPGFDCLGVSCTIYNDMELTLLQEPELQIFVEGEGADNIPTDDRNLAWKSIQKLLPRGRGVQRRDYPHEKWYSAFPRAW